MHVDARKFEFGLGQRRRCVMYVSNIPGVCVLKLVYKGQTRMGTLEQQQNKILEFLKTEGLAKRYRSHIVTHDENGHLPHLTPANCT